MPGPSSIVFVISRVSVGGDLHCPIGNPAPIRIVPRRFSHVVRRSDLEVRVCHRSRALTNHTDREGTSRVMNLFGT